MRLFVVVVVLAFGLVQAVECKFANGPAWKSPVNANDLKNWPNLLKKKRVDNVLTAEAMTKFYHTSKSFDDSPMALPQSPIDLIVIEGFQFCNMYDGSHFRKDVQFFPVFSMDESDHEQAVPTTISEFGEAEFTAFIDKVAKQVLSDIRKARNKDATTTNYPSLRRLACYFAVDGKNSYLHFAKMKLLQWVDGKTYYPKIAWPAQPNYRYIDGASNGPIADRADLPHFKLAFTVLCHENAKALKYLIQTLFAKSNAGDVIVIIHVDGKAKEFAKEVDHLIVSQGWKHVLRTKDSHIGAWGGAGLVYGQLSAYFELLDICRFDYVINLSAYDVILMDTDVMYKYIHQQSNGKISLVTNLNEEGNDIDATRLDRIATLHTSKGLHPAGLMPDGFLREESNDLPAVAFRLRVSPPQGYGYQATNQWNVLTYGFVHNLRYDPVAPTILIPFEWSFLVDEVYFGAWAQWNPDLAKVEEFHTRCFDWGSNYRPTMLTMKKSKRFLKKCVKNGRMIARKYDVAAEPGMKEFFVTMRDDSRKMEAAGRFKINPSFRMERGVHRALNQLWLRMHKNKHIRFIEDKLYEPVRLKVAKTFNL